MIIAISGRPGGGKDSVAECLKKLLNFPIFTSGGFMRDLAVKRGISFKDLMEEAKHSPEIDNLCDDWMEKLGKEKDNFIMIGRTSGHFIPHAIKIFLDVSVDEAADRIFKAKRSEEPNSDIEATKDFIRFRRESEELRYMKHYKYDYKDPNNYDFYLDTSDLTLDEVCKRVIDFLKSSGNI
ncbi:MAG: cytidylate kinase family protein [Candidatus Nanoarchaeia archaeon]